MKTDLQLDFLVDKENKTIQVKREFAASLGAVWAAWTKPELLDQWWAPKPWKAETKAMDFRVGGYWLYAMVGPNGERHYGRADYTSITPLKEFTGLDGFCDENGVIDKELPRNQWKTNFQQQSNFTLVSIQLTFDSLADLEKIIDMGFKEGFTIALEGLDNLLLTFK